MRPDPLNRRFVPGASCLLVALLAILVCVPMVAQVFLPARRVVPSPSLSAGCDYVVGTAVFDGANDFLRTGPATSLGITDSKVFTFSTFFKVDAGGDASEQVFFSISTLAPVTRFSINRNASGTIRLFGRNAAAVNILDVSGTATVKSTNGWVHVFACIDLADTAKRKIYINGVSDTLVVTTYSNDTIDMVGVNYLFTVGATGGDTAKLNGALAQTWFTTAYTDDPGAWATTTPCPNDLGANGSGPTGVQPILFLKDSGDDYRLNYGTGVHLNLTGSLGTTTPP